jgi:hypothetical protein
MGNRTAKNASLVIDQRLIMMMRVLKSQEKPSTPLLAEREEKSSGVAICQEAKSEAECRLLF